MEGNSFFSFTASPELLPEHISGSHCVEGLQLQQKQVLGILIHATQSQPLLKQKESKEEDILIGRSQHFYFVACISDCLKHIYASCFH